MIVEYGRGPRLYSALQRRCDQSTTAHPDDLLLGEN